MSGESTSHSPERVQEPLRDSFTVLDPLGEPAWDSMLPAGASFFHTRCWAQVLHETYAHRPVYFCKVEHAQLKALLPVMEVSSRWTGVRGVSLPFSDFCPIHVSEEHELESLFRQILSCGREREWKYFESRSNNFQAAGGAPSLSFYGHLVELNAKPDTVFARFESATRRGIRKAEREGLVVEFATSAEAMRDFYALHCQTRRKHGVPPQPVEFFDSIRRHVLCQGKGFVATARLNGTPAAATVFFHHGREALYKFGASDSKVQHLRPNNLLMWEAIKRCAEVGCDTLHLGRSSLGQEGLRRFKLGLGARESQLRYYRFDFKQQAFVTTADRAQSAVTSVFRCLPAPLFRLAGRHLYRHLS